jgi:hypothetical protein
MQLREELRDVGAPAILGASVWDVAPDTKRPCADASNMQLPTPLPALIWGAPVKML